MNVSVLQVDSYKLILGLDAFDNAPARQHLERKLVQSPVQDSPIQDWLLTTFLGYDEVRAVKPLPHLGWRDRLDCILCQEDSNLLVQDRGVSDRHRRFENAVELGRSPGELNRVAESNCAREPARLGSVNHASRRCASGSNGTINVPVVVQRKGVGWMVQKSVCSETSSPNSLGPKRDWPEVRLEVHRPRTVPARVRKQGVAHCSPTSDVDRNQKDMDETEF